MNESQAQKKYKEARALILVVKDFAFLTLTSIILQMRKKISSCVIKMSIVHPSMFFAGAKIAN